jgi:hypothetical protein
VLSPKYHGNIDPHKFLMYYKAAIALAGGDKATLRKSLITSLEDGSGIPDFLQDASIPDSSSKTNFSSTSRGSKWSSTLKKIFCSALKERKKYYPIST